MTYSGVLSAMSAMVNLEIPWINVMSKMDLVLPNPEDPAGGGRNGIRTRRNIARYVVPSSYARGIILPGLSERVFRADTLLFFHFRTVAVSWPFSSHF
jgi:hypothetical protein